MGGEGESGPSENTPLSSLSYISGLFASVALHLVFTDYGGGGGYGSGGGGGGRRF